MGYRTILLTIILVLLLILMYKWVRYLSETMTFEYRDIIMIRHQMSDPVPTTPDRHNAEVFFENLGRHSNDPQNSHDPGIIRDLNKKYKKLLTYNREFENSADVVEILKSGVSMDDLITARTTETVRSIKAETQSLFRDDPELALKLDKINFITGVISKGADFTSFETPVKENQILILVWSRVNHPSNESRRDDVKRAFINQLLDCVRDAGRLGFIAHCVNGRVGRMISALTLVDSDPDLSEPERDENEMTNVVYMRASAILQEELNSKKMQELYVFEPNTLNPEEARRVSEFVDATRNRIKDVLHSEYKGVFSEPKLRSIINLAVQGV